jgi:hypothetical protein
MQNTGDKIKNIELELRAEVSLDYFQELLSDLEKNTVKKTFSKRLSVMFLGNVNESNFDIRVRINSNGEAELVLKKGDFHVHDRIEVSQNIEKDQFLGLVDVFSLLKFKAKVTERENFDFDLGNGITLVLVRADSIAYIEIEKMSHKEDLEKNRTELLKILKKLKLKPIEDDEEFHELCHRLTKYSDWKLDCSQKARDRLESMLDSY